MQHDDQSVVESLVAHGAALGGYARGRHPLPFEQALVRGLEVAHRDATVLRVLPALLKVRADSVGLDKLRTAAVQLGCEAELGFLVDLTDELFEVPRLRSLLAALQHAKHPDSPVLFFDSEQGSERARRLAEVRTPATARRWGFLMNMPESGFKGA